MLLQPDLIPDVPKKSTKREKSSAFGRASKEIRNSSRTEEAKNKENELLFRDKTRKN